MSGAHAERKRRMLYGRRKGPKLSAHQQHLLNDLLPGFELKLALQSDPRGYFCGLVDDVWLEVGFGGGEHLAWQAQHRPDVGVIGAEPYVNGVVKLLSQLVPPSGSLRSPPPPQAGEEYAFQTPAPIPSSPVYGGGAAQGGGGGNIRIYTGDARDILEALPDACLGRVFILFPDPWPKTRHHKRRFIQMDMLDKLARVMRGGAELRFASDDADYVEWALERLMAHPAFVWTATCAADWQTRPADWPPTRYEAKQLHGEPVFLRFIRH